MAVTLVQTPGAYNSNTYVTLSDAETILESALASTVAAWDAACANVKNRALVNATRQIDNLRLAGEKYYSGRTESDLTLNQALHFPTTANKDTDDDLYIPQEVENATALQAAYLLRIASSSIGSEAANINGVKRRQIGHTEEEYFGSSTSKSGLNKICDEAMEELNGNQWVIHTTRLIEG